MRVLASGLLLAALTFSSGSSGADPSQDRLRTCVSEQNDAVRLACYDKEMGRAAQGQPADFGMTADLLRKKQAEAGIAPPPPPTSERLSAKVTKVVTRSTGRLVVTLDNGQVWEQQEDVDFGIKIGDVVTVSHGALGALWMEDPSHRRRTRVKRLT